MVGWTACDGMSSKYHVLMYRRLPSTPGCLGSRCFRLSPAYSPISLCDTYFGWASRNAPRGGDATRLRRPIPPPEVRIAAPPPPPPAEAIRAVPSVPPPATVAIAPVAPAPAPAAPAAKAPPAPARMAPSVVCSNYTAVTGEAAYPPEAVRAGLDRGAALVQFEVGARGRSRRRGQGCRGRPCIAPDLRSQRRPHRRPVQVPGGQGHDVLVQVPFGYALD